MGRPKITMKMLKDENKKLRAEVESFNKALIKCHDSIDAMKGENRELKLQISNLKEQYYTKIYKAHHTIGTALADALKVLEK